MFADFPICVVMDDFHTLTTLIRTNFDVTSYTIYEVKLFENNDVLDKGKSFRGLAYNNLEYSAISASEGSSPETKASKIFLFMLSR